MANYEVFYDIQVTTGNAVGTLNAFEQAVAPLAQSAKTLSSISRSLNAFKKATEKMKPVTINVSISKGTLSQLDNVLNKIRQIRRESRGMVAGGYGGAIAGGSRATSSRAMAAPMMRQVRGGGSYGYKVLGPTPIDVNGVAAIDFLKGMGIAYGIAGAGQLVSSIVKNATQYDNLIQSTKNILKTHDKQGNFGARFAEMESVIRDVGIQTKFTAPEVADAAKFLAMAGLKIEEINQSIRPIADIALIGDTDLGQTADVVTNIMTAYRKKPGEMRNIADVMTMTFTKSNTTLMEMAEAYKYSAALLSAGGIDFEEASGALGVLGDAGIKGSQAGTTMRTIMANIVNPTKKQLANWERIGVQRFDENGKVRNLRAIFKDLADAGLYVDDFYKLFHKTAAQGAVSLANSVDKWNKIVADNFLSTGLSKKLADEKKNTLQGLWAQLTSAFTEDGMQGFGGIQETIKDALRRGISWLKGDEAKRLFKVGAENFMEFGGMLMDSLRQIFKLFKTFGPLIKTYFKFQLWIYPLLTIVRALKSILLLGRGLLSLRGGLSGAIMGLGFNPYLLANGTAIGGASGAAGAAAIQGGAIMAGAWAPGQRVAYRRGWGAFANPFIWMRNQATANDSLANRTAMMLTGGMLPNTRANRIQAGIAAREGMPTRLDKAQRQALWRKTQINAMRDWYGIDSSKWTEGQYKQWFRANNGQYVNGTYVNRQQANSGIRAMYAEERYRQDRKLQRDRQKAGRQGAARWGRQRLGAGALGAAAGIGMGAMIASSSDWSSGGILAGGMSAALSVAMMGGPVGWIGGAAIAVGTLAASWIAAGEETRKAQQAIDDYVGSIHTFNGVLVGEGATTAMKALNTMYNINLDTNQLMRDRIEMMRELLGLSSSGVDTTGTRLSVDAANHVASLLDAVDSWKGSGKMAENANKMVKGFKIDGIDQGYWSDGRLVWKRPDGKYYYFNNPDGTSDEQDTAAAFAAAVSLAVNGQEAKDIVDRFTELKRKALWNQSDKSVVDAISKEFNAQYSLDALFNGYTDSEGKYHEPRVDPDSYETKWNYSSETWHAWNGQDWSNKMPYLQTLHAIYNPLFGSNASFNTVAASYFTKKASGTLEESDIVSYISEMDNSMGAFLKGYTHDTISEWYRSMGIDPETGTISEVAPGTRGSKGFSAKENAEAIAGFATMMLQLIPTFSEPERQKLLELQIRLQWLKDLATGQSYDTTTHGALNVQEYKAGDTWESASGVTYKRDANGKWTAVNGAGWSVTPPMTDAQITANKQLDNEAKSDGGSDDGKHGGNGGGGNDERYKNQYKNSSAAPKQIIVNIESLMNVESVDLSKPDNRLAINDLKEQLGQMLVEVAADFTHSSNMLNNG